MAAKKSDLLLCTGFLFIGGGVMLLTFLFSDSPTNFFFIFPFFFVGNIGPIGILFIAVFIAMIGVFIWQMSFFTRYFDVRNSNAQSPLQYGECIICRAGVPLDADYCPKCGTKINENTAD